MNKKSKNFKKIYNLLKKELVDEMDIFKQIELENNSSIVVNNSVHERFNKNIILQFNAKKLIDNVDCTCCLNNCTSTDKKINHILSDFFASPETFLESEFQIGYPNFFE